MSCLIKDGVRTMLTCRPDVCSCLPISVSVKENLIILELWPEYGRYKHVVRMDALEYWNLLELWKASGCVATTFGWMQTWTIQSFLTLMGVRTVLPPLPDRCCLTDERSDARQDSPDGILGSDFSNLESVQNLIKASWSKYLKWRLWN
jgi:hypothetical protein